MKKIRNILTLFILVLAFFSSIPVSAKADYKNYESSELKEYTVIVGYDEKDEEIIFNGLTEEERENFLEDKTKEVFECLSKNDNVKIDKLKQENPKLDIVIQKNGSEENSFIVNNQLPENSIKLEENKIVPYSYDTDTYVSTKRFRVSNDGASYANCVAKVRVNRDLTNKQVTIVGIDVSVIESFGKFGFTPIYNGNNTAKLAWTYLGYDGYGNGTIYFTAHFNKTVDMY